MTTGMIGHGPFGSFIGLAALRSDDSVKRKSNPQQSQLVCRAADALSDKPGCLARATKTIRSREIGAEGSAAKSLRSFDCGLSSVLVKARAKALWSDGGGPTLDPVVV